MQANWSTNKYSSCYIALWLCKAWWL